MLIRYSDGTVQEGVILAKTESVMRIAIPGSEDTAELRRASGTWITPDCEPVTVSLTIPEPGRETEFSQEAFICSPELARLLKSLLLTDSAPECQSAPPQFEELGAPLRMN